MAATLQFCQRLLRWGESNPELPRPRLSFELDDTRGSCQKTLKQASLQHLDGGVSVQRGLDRKIMGSQNRFAEFQHLRTVVDAQHNEGVQSHIRTFAILLIPTTREYGLPLEARSSASRS
jgi:hypothetical protein